MSDEYQRQVDRMGRWLFGLGCIGTLVIAVRFQLRDAAGFAAGTAGAYVNMRWLARALNKQDATSLGLIVVRYIVLAGVAYGMLKVFGISPLFVLVGLLTASLAAICDIFFQLIYART